jgi:integrase
MAGIVRHRQPKGPATDRSLANDLFIYDRSPSRHGDTDYVGHGEHGLPSAAYSGADLQEPRALTLALTSELVALLRKYFRNSGAPVFDATNLRREWERATAAAKMPELLIHDLRRSGARNLRSSGVAETVIMQIGGWKTANVFRRYAIVAEDDISKAMAALEQANGVLAGND